MLVLQTNEGDTMNNAANRARKRDNAARLGKLQTGLNIWLDTTPGQLSLLALVAVAFLVTGLIGR